MIDKRMPRTLTTVAICLGLAIPGDLVRAAEPTDTIHFTAATTTVVDVQLGEGGVLKGRVVDAQGVAAARVSVVVQQAGENLAKTETDQQGDFAIRGLRGAVYHVVAESSGRVIRAWAPQTAPPAAHDRVLVVVGQDLVLGQRHAGMVGHFWSRAKYALTNPLVATGIVALAVGIPVAVNSNRDRNSES